LDRSQGGLAAKIHAVVDKQGRPIKLKLTAGQDAYITSAPEMIADLQEGDILNPCLSPSVEAIVDRGGRAAALAEIRYGGTPARNTQKMQLSTRRSSTRGLPRVLLGRTGRITLHSKSLSS